MKLNGWEVLRLVMHPPEESLYLFMASTEKCQTRKTGFWSKL